MLEETLKIVMNEPREVEPRTPLRGVLQLVSANRKVFAVRLTRGGILVGNHPFTLRTDYVDDSGGHDHTNRRTDNNENYGYFISQQGSGQQGRPLSENTMSHVMNGFEYVASIWGDTMKIITTSGRHPKFLTDTIKIIERIPGLEPLPAGTNYVKVGGTTQHHGPPDFAEDQNHYGAGTLIGHVQAIADSFAVAFERYRLRINDMSLEFGGLFDTGNKWLIGLEEAHAEHRIGENADIGFKGIDAENRCIDFNKEELLLKIRKYTKGRVKAHDDHYHIRMRES